MADNDSDQMAEHGRNDAELEAELRSDALDAQWETVLQEYREGLRERPHDLAPRAPASAREDIEQAAAIEAANDQTEHLSLRSWSRFPGWFGPLFEPDEVAAR